MNKLKLAVNRRLNPGDEDSKHVDTFIIILIGFNVLAVMLETEPILQENYPNWFFWFEMFSTTFFSIEYVCRIWVCTLNPLYTKPVKGRLAYAFTLMAMVDLIAILPTFLSFVAMDTRFVRAIRLLRLVRILKMGRYAYAVETLTNVFSRKKEELAITGFVLIMLMILCSSLVYFVEHSNQPDVFASIPQSLWWTVVTLTSVGYGDQYPTSVGGQIVGGIVSMIGVLFVALPTGILSAGFAEEIREQRRGKDSETFGFCPHCGKQLIPGEDLE
jgi:voltage-gated potassium channel